jgi:predicted deacylase
MNGELRVGSFAASRGTKIDGFLKAGDLASHSVEIPVILVAGREDGPTLSITAGMHATEYVGIVAAFEIGRRTDSSKLRGNLIIAPLMNRYGFDALSLRINPVDGANLNRIFPGNPEGTISYQIVDQVFKNVISSSDCYIDFHGGELFESLIPFIVCFDTGDEALYGKAMKLVRAFGTKYVWHAPDPDSQPNQATGFAIAQAMMKGIPAFAAEAGTEAKLDPPSVEILVQGTFNVMRELGMLDEPATTNPEPIESRKEMYLVAKKSGMLYSYVKEGDEVLKGQKVFEVKSLPGEPLETINSPANGIILSTRTNPVIKNGDNAGLLLELH